MNPDGFIERANERIAALSDEEREALIRNATVSITGWQEEALDRVYRGNGTKARGILHVDELASWTPQERATAARWLGERRGMIRPRPTAPAKVRASRKAERQNRRKGRRQ